MARKVKPMKRSVFKALRPPNTAPGYGADVTGDLLNNTLYLGNTNEEKLILKVRKWAEKVVKGKKKSSMSGAEKRARLQAYMKQYEGLEEDRRSDLRVSAIKAYKRMKKEGKLLKIADLKKRDTPMDHVVFSVLGSKAVQGKKAASNTYLMRQARKDARHAKSLREDIINRLVEVTISNAGGSVSMSGAGTGGGKGGRLSGGFGRPASSSATSPASKSSQLGGGFGSRGSSGSRFGGQKAAGGYASGTAGGGYRTPVTQNRPAATPARTSGGRIGGGDPKMRSQSPGSRPPGAINAPRRPNPTGGNQARGGSPLGGRGSIYGGNRTYTGQSSNRYGGRSPMASLRTRSVNMGR